MGLVMRALCVTVTIGGYVYGLGCATDPEGPAWYTVEPGWLPAVGDCAECIPPAWLLDRAGITMRPRGC